MSAADFARSFPAEDAYVEWKTGLGSAAIQAAVVAFSNAEGGVLLIGVDDAGTVVGRELTASVADEIHRTIAETRDPGRYSLHDLRVDGTPVVVVAVARRVEGFAQTSNGRVVVRRGTRKVALFGAELVQFINGRTLQRFEETGLPVGIEAASPALVAELATAFGWTRDLPSRLAEHGLLREDAETLTVAGALCLLAEPAELLGKTFIEVLRFPAAGAEHDRRVEIRGPIQHQVERAVEEVVSELGSELVVLGVRRHELPRLPRVVLREAIANALAHRSYEMTGTATRIETYPDRVRITSPGGLPEPVTVDNIRETQAARNYRVITVLRRLGLAEDAGRGVDVMMDGMVEEMLDPPTFEDSGRLVTVDLPIRSVVAPSERAWVREVESRGSIEPRHRILLVHAARGERLTNGRARTLTGSDAESARRSLQRLRDARFLVQHGNRGGASYTLDESLAPPAGLRLSRPALKAVIVELATSEDAPLTNARVRERTGLDRVEALRLLEELVTERRIERVGERRGTRYILR